MSLRIGCDLDGTLADMDAAIAEMVERLFGPVAVAATEPTSPPAGSTTSEAAEATAPSPADATGKTASPDPPPDDVPEDEAAAPAARMLTGRQQSRLWQEIRATENFWEQLREIETGVVARLGALAQERRWEVIFITQRPSSAGDTCQIQSQRWLQRLGFPYPSVVVIRGTRGKIAAALDLDLVIDDRPENCLDVVVDSKARSILVWRGDSQATVAVNARRLGIEVTPSIHACLDSLVEGGSGTEKTGLLGKIRKFIGSQT
jgi:uncharacterized HAD superfamily protein